MKIDELLNILHFQHDVALKCSYKFSTFKYYSRIHQTFNGKVGLKLNLTNHFQTYLLSIFIMPKFFKFCNHLIINSKKGTMFLLCYFKLFSIYFLLLLSKTRPFFTTLEKITFSIYFTMLSPEIQRKLFGTRGRVLGRRTCFPIFSSFKLSLNVSATLSFTSSSPNSLSEST